MENEKCVLVIDGSLPSGVIANTACILGITLGQRRPEAVGPDVWDGDGRAHAGIVTFPVPILCAGRDALSKLRARLYEPEFAELTAVDFSELAQGCKTYEEFTGKAAGTSGQALSYLGIGICGAKKAVNRLTGSLPLLR